MITFLKTIDTAGGLYVEGFCTSDDFENLPVIGICNGSKMDVLTLAEEESSGEELPQKAAVKGGATKAAADGILPDIVAPPTGTISQARFVASTPAWVMIGTAEADDDGGGSDVVDVDA